MVYVLHKELVNGQVQEVGSHLAEDQNKSGRPVWISPYEVLLSLLINTVYHLITIIIITIIIVIIITIIMTLIQNRQNGSLPVQEKLFKLII